VEVSRQYGGLSRREHQRQLVDTGDPPSIHRTTARMQEVVFGRYGADDPLFSSAGQFTTTFNGCGLSDEVLIRNR